MNAIHNEPYEVTSLQNLTSLAQLAEDYGAIPIVSSTLDVVLMKRNEQFETDLIYQSCEVMNEAIRLQNPTLYRESLLLSVGPWQNPHYRDYEHQGEDSYGSDWYNPAVSALSRSFRNKMGRTVMDAQLSVQWGIRYQNVGLFKEGIWQEMKDVVDQLTRLLLNVEDEELELSLYFRELLGFQASDFSYPFLENDLVSWRLRNNELKIVGNARADYLAREYFLFGTIDDADLPWNTTKSE